MSVMQDGKMLIGQNQGADLLEFFDNELFEINEIENLLIEDGKFVNIVSHNGLCLTIGESGISKNNNNVPAFQPCNGSDEQKFELQDTGVENRFPITTKYIKNSDGWRLSLGWNPSQGGWFAYPATIYDDMKWFVTAEDDWTA